VKRQFICLANSKKYTQRCIAGIELEKSARKGYKYQIVRRAENPLWLRPVSSSDHGEVTAELVDHINLLDIVEVNVIAPAPQGYQSENVLFDNQRLEVVDKIDKKEALLDKLLAVDQPALFGNKDKVVQSYEIGRLDHSLLLIKPVDVFVFEAINPKGNSQIRASFTYGTTLYDLPVTDIDFIEKFAQNRDILQGCNHIYFTVSLGIAYNGRHYKLVAGIIYF
jgi:hypothetical protein